MRIYPIIVALLTGIAPFALAPAAHAADPVVYEVRSPTVPVANIDWSDTAGQHTLQNVQLPWRTSVMVDNAHSDEARLSAEWQPGAISYPNAGRYMWVTLRIYSKGSLLCESTVDLGKTACTGRGFYVDSETPR
ncbi:MAG: hypothetical protein ACRDTV_11770 [Mycobacterium sp.]